MRIYIDESGNSGLRVFERDQPIYSCAAVWMNAATHSLVQESFFSPAARKKYNIQSGDIKGSDLIKNKRGQTTIKGIADLLSKKNVPINCLIIHKKFLSAAWIVEDCLDHAYNDSPKVTVAWTWPGKHKINAAETIMDGVTEDVLSNWWQARIDGNAADLKKYSDDAASQLAGKAYSAELGEMILGFSAEKCLSGESKTTTDGMSPNLIAFNTLVQRINITANKLKAQNLEIVHDEQRQFEDSITHYAKLVINLEKRDKEPIKFGISEENQVTFGIDCIDRVVFEDSKKQIALQIADCFAALSRKVGDIGLRMVKESTGMKDVEFPILEPLHSLYRNDLIDIYWIGPADWSVILEDLVVPKVK